MADTPKLYASLIGPLLGMYYPMPAELDTVTKCCLALNTSKLKSLWSSVYSKRAAEAQIQQYGGLLLPDNLAAHLDYDTYTVEVQGASHEG